MTGGREARSSWFLPSIVEESELWLGFVGYCDPASAEAAAAYEDAVLALMPGHGARVVVRGRRRRDQATNLPAELHVLWFPSRDAYDAFVEDPARQALVARFGEVFSEKVVVELDEPTMPPGISTERGDAL